MWFINEVSFEEWSSKLCGQHIGNRKEVIHVIITHQSYTDLKKKDIGSIMKSNCVVVNKE